MLLDEITKQLEWYERYIEGDTSPQDIPTLLRFNDSLAIRSYHLANETGAAKGEYNRSFFIRRIEVSRSKQALITKGMKVNAAEVAADLENKDKYEAEIEAETVAYTKELILRQVNRVIASCQQRISHLKQEYDKSHRQDAT